MSQHTVATPAQEELKHELELVDMHNKSLREENAVAVATPAKTINYDELRKEDWVLDEILKGIEVRREVARRADSNPALSEEKRREVTAKMDAECAHGWRYIYELDEAEELRQNVESLIEERDENERRLRSAALPFRLPAEKPENKEDIFAFTKWDTGRTQLLIGKFYEASECYDKKPRVICDNETDCFWDQVLVWIRHVDVIRALYQFTQWQERAQ